MKFLTIFITMIGLVFAINANSAEIKHPYLSVSNLSNEYTLTIKYSTASQPHGKLVVKPGSVVGMPKFGEGEKVAINEGFLFTSKTGGALPFENWCPNLSPRKEYDQVSVKVSPAQTKTGIEVVCERSPE